LNVLLFFDIGFTNLNFHVTMSIVFYLTKVSKEEKMGKENCRFEPEILAEMDKFEKDFLSNQYRKDTSENKGPNYKDKIAENDRNAFFEYLEDDFSEEFLNLK